MKELLQIWIGPRLKIKEVFLEWVSLNLAPDKWVGACQGKKPGQLFSAGRAAYQLGFMSDAFMNYIGGRGRVRVLKPV